MNDDKNQSGGVNISGTIGSVGGDITGRDKVIGALTGAAIDGALRPLFDAIGMASSDVRADAAEKLAALRQETAKGKNADDHVIAKLLDGLVALVPAAASAIVSAFATPILASITGPVTAAVLASIGGG